MEESAASEPVFRPAFAYILMRLNGVRSRPVNCHARLEDMPVFNARSPCVTVSTSHTVKIRRGHRA